MKSAKTITMDDIARLANVSKPTVSRALNGSPLVTEETKRHILKVASDNGYVVNRNAQKLRSKRANTIAVVLDFSNVRANFFTDPFILNLLAGVSEALGHQSQDLLLCSPDHTNTATLISNVRSHMTDGIIFLGHGTRTSEYLELVKAGVPFVVWGAATPGNPYCVVGTDNEKGGQLVGQHLLDRGCKSCLFIGNTDHEEVKLRYKGVSDVLDPSHLEHLHVGDFSYSSHYEAASKLLKDGHSLPDSIFACSDTSAMAVISALKENGIEVGKDILVVGYNDVPSSAHFAPSISTIRQDVEKAGQALVAKIMQILAGEEVASEKLETRLIVRQSG
ncbi:MAG: LacI family DNA-binding transcriptional regulator [Sphingomonadales bacterium]|jgi:DNA-binding LacI/PurR family transcriptional regulator